MQQNEFVIKFSKKCDVWQHFLSEACVRGVLYAHNMWLLILLVLFFILAIALNLLILMKNTEHDLWPQPPLLPCSLLRRSNKNNQLPLLQKQLTQLAIVAEISLVTSHSGCCGCTNVCPPTLSNNTGMFNCCQGWGGSYYLACHTSHGTAWTMQKLNS